MIKTYFGYFKFHHQISGKNIYEYNIGDYIQTMAQLNIYRKIIEKFYNKKYSMEHFLPIVFDNTLDDFEFVALERDQISNHYELYKSVKIIMIMNGWFMHPINKKYDFPPPSNIEPIFVSIHIKDDTLLSPDTLKYFKLHEPIGCRDTYTMNLLKSHNIDAYFTGCLSLTLDCFDGMKKKNNASYVVDVEYNAKKTGHISHLIKSPRLIHERELIIKACNLLKRYYHASSINTSSLLCYLVCKVFGTPVQLLCSQKKNLKYKNFANNPRFSGLVDFDDDLIMNSRMMKIHLLKKITSMIVFPRENIDICFCTDTKYLKLLPTVINSVFENNFHYQVNIFVIHNNIDNDLIERHKLFTELTYGYNITFINCSKKPVYKKHKRISEATMLRLYIPELINSPRVIYLDLDIIVNCDLLKLYKMEVNNTGIAAFSLNLVPGERGATARQSNYTLKFNRHFNAGILLMDLDTLRKNNFNDKIETIMKLHPFDDQVVLNVYTKEKYTELPMQYNVINNLSKFYDVSGLIATGDYILHFAGDEKPWENKKVLHKHVWDKYYLNKKI